MKKEWGMKLDSLALPDTMQDHLAREVGIETIEGLISLASLPQGYQFLQSLVDNDAQQLEQLLAAAREQAGPERLEEIKEAGDFTFHLGALLEMDEGVSEHDREMPADSLGNHQETAIESETEKDGDEK